jgi:hypothetical protein
MKGSGWATTNSRRSFITRGVYWFTTELVHRRDPPCFVSRSRVPDSTVKKTHRRRGPPIIPGCPTLLRSERDWRPSINPPVTYSASHSAQVAVISRSTSRIALAWFFCSRPTLLAGFCALETFAGLAHTPEPLLQSHQAPTARGSKQVLNYELLTRASHIK